MQKRRSLLVLCILALCLSGQARGDPCGAVIADGTLAKNPGVWQNLSVPVPAAGGYILSTQDNGVGWAIRTQVDAPLSVKIEGEADHKHQGGKNWYFYVPAGTTNVHYFPGTDNYTHEVRGPNNEYIATVTEDGEIKTVAVPPGLDGRMWTLTFPYQPRTIWFYNCPNWISAAKNALMVPREVAISDGLDIR